MSNLISLRSKDRRYNQSGSFRPVLSRVRQVAGLVFLPLAVMASAGIASAQVTTVSATSLKGVQITRGPDATVTSSTTWIDVPGATMNFTVEPGESFLFAMRYTAESVCFGTGGWCSVRLVLNGSEANPAVGSDFAFDSSDGGNASSAGWKGHAVDRSLRYTNTGTKTHTITAEVQYLVTDPGIEFRVDDWQFTVEKFE